MSSFRLLTLRLASPLRYSRAFGSSRTESTEAGGLEAILASGGLEADGTEKLILFDQGSLIRDDASEGPRLVATPGGPVFSGINAEAALIPPGAAPSAGDTFVLESGLYAFMQWRPASVDEIAEGIEFFARQTWWEGLACSGPWVVRLVAEDKKTATQVLRKLENPAAVR